jgi:hypothetical protein
LLSRSVRDIRRSLENELVSYSVMQFRFKIWLTSSIEIGDWYITFIHNQKEGQIWIAFIGRHILERRAKDINWRKPLLCRSASRPRLRVLSIFSEAATAFYAIPATFRTFGEWSVIRPIQNPFIVRHERQFYAASTPITANTFFPRL